MPDPFVDTPEYVALSNWRSSFGDRPNELAWSYLIGGDGIVVDADEISQTIGSVILMTRPGEDIHRPTFASDIWDHLDRPTNRINHFLIRESLDAVERWEPRVDLDTLALGVNSVLGQVALEVNWTLLQNPDIDGGAQVVYER